MKQGLQRTRHFEASLNFTVQKHFQPNGKKRELAFHTRQFFCARIAFGESEPLILMAKFTSLRNMMSQQKVCNTIYVYSCHKFSPGRTRFQSIILALTITIMMTNFATIFALPLGITSAQSIIHFSSALFSLPFVCSSELLLNSFTTQTSWNVDTVVLHALFPKKFLPIVSKQVFFSQQSACIYFNRVKAFLLLRSAHKVTHSKGKHKRERVCQLSSIPCRVIPIPSKFLNYGRKRKGRLG